MVITRLDHTSAGGLDLISCDMMKQVWNRRGDMDGERRWLCFFDHLVNGDISHSISIYIWLVALVKKKPICIPNVVIRIGQNVLMTLFEEKMRSAISSSQVAMGTKGGADLMIEMACRISEMIRRDGKFAALSIDMVNCFNKVSRYHSLKLVAERLPMFYRMYYAMYGNGNVIAA